MKTATLFLASLAFSVASFAAGAPRLALWVTESMGTGPGDNCKPWMTPEESTGLPATPPTLTERDVVAWDRKSARWTLDSKRFSVGDAAKKLHDHCFVLAIDGKFISNGVMLSERTPRMTGFPTISVYDRNNALYFQLTSGNHGSHTSLMYVDVLDAVLGNRGKAKR